MPETNPLLYQARRLLGAQVVEVERIFGEMACMRNVEREQWAGIEIVKTLFTSHDEKGNLKNPKLISFLNKIQRIIQIYGMAFWPRTEITDLSAKAATHPLRQERDLGGNQPTTDEFEGMDLEGALYADEGTDSNLSEEPSQ
jgi:hypothetical protein